VVHIITQGTKIEIWHPLSKSTRETSLMKTP